MYYLKKPSLKLSFLRFKITTTFLFFIFCFKFSFAVNLDLPSDERVPIRSNIKSCRSFLIPGNQHIDDSVGIPFSTNNIIHFRNELIEAIRIHGLERFRDAKFFVVGIPMKDLRKTQKLYLELEQELGLERVRAQIIVFDVPSDLVLDESISLARRIFEKTLYFFPSLKKDYQRPQIGELISGFSTSAIQELPNMVLLFERMPLLDATLAVTSHTIILSSFLIYEKSLINWILRSGATSEKNKRIEMFLKNMLVSLPFVLSYNVFGNFSKILDFYSKHGFVKMAEAFPNEVLNFGATQGLTLFLQALFYSQVINSGYSAWVNRQVGEINSRDARTIRPWIEMPVLMLNTALLAWASSGQADILYSLGPLDLNTGHLALASLTAAGGYLFYISPGFLNPTLGWYNKIKDFVNQIKAKK